MTTVAELFDSLKYRVDVHPVTGARRYFNHADQLHCEDGPALIFPNGTGVWYHNGLRHRINGPAVVFPDGRKEWWLNGKRYNSVKTYHREELHQHR